MKKGLISIGVLVGFLFGMILVTGVLAKDVIEFKGGTTGKVTFTHQKHVDMKYECTKCHHTWKKGETTGKLCKDCHKATKEASKDGKGIVAKDAYHNDCKKCHEEAKKANKPAGPTICTKCHIKAK